MNENTRIEVSARQMQQASELYSLLRLGDRERMPLSQRARGLNLSHTQYQPRVYAHPGFRAALARETGEVMAFNQPDLGDVHVDALLTNISIAYRNGMYIGGMVFPRVLVTRESNKYFTFDQSPWLRDEAKVRAVGSAYQRGGYTLSTSSYSVEEYGYETPIDDRIRANADSPVDLDRDGIAFVSDKIDMKLEKSVATVIQTTGNWTTNATLAGTTQWNDYTNSDPFGDLKTARLTILKQLGLPANTAVMNVEVFETLALHPDLLDRVKYTGTGERPAMVTAQMMAELFQVDQLLVGMALEDTAAEGASSSIGFIWGKHCWVGYVPAEPALNRPAAGYTFTTGRKSDRYREEAIKSDVIRADEAFAVTKTASGGGYRIINAAA